MRNRIPYYCIFIIFGVSSFVNAQRLHELTPYSFYQEWALDSEESNNKLLVFKPRDRFQTIDLNYTYSVLNFQRQHYLLYFLSSKSTKRAKPAKEIKPLKWSNTPKKAPNDQRCGNYIVDKKNIIRRPQLAKSKWKKGNWRVFIKDQTRFLVIEHKVSKNGKDYTVDKKEEFQIVSLEEHRMVLRKVKLHEENL
ncbi:MAG: hypothetical protein AB8B59_03540 [Maribacter sp.]